MARRVIVDCDPGHDDALAILLAAASPALELEAITTVAGNQTLERTTLNARRVCSVAGIDSIPIAAGCERPLERMPVVAAEIHGESGLDGPQWGEPTVPLDERHAVDLIAEHALRHENPLDLIACGPLTNIATVLTSEPRISGHIGRIAIMGGAIGLGNVTPSAEFNIYADPEAASIVFASGIPITLVPLEVTHQALATVQVMARIAALETQVADMAVALLRYFADAYERVFGFSAPAVHDPCAVAALAQPSIVSTRELNVAIDTASELNLGRTVVDVYGTTGRPSNADVAMSLEVDRFWQLMIDALASYGPRSLPA